MKTLVLTFFENIPFGKIKEFWFKTDKVLFFEIMIIVLLIFAKVYVSSNYIYEKKIISKMKKEIKEDESSIKTMKIQLGMLKNREKLKEYSKNNGMEENIEVVIVKE